MIKGGKGGGNTRTGLVFEGKVDLSTFLSNQPGYEVKEGKVFYKGEQVARIFKKGTFYKFLKNWELIGSPLFQRGFIQMIVFM